LPSRSASPPAPALASARAAIRYLTVPAIEKMGRYMAIMK
jgi:hypothetical protein